VSLSERELLILFCCVSAVLIISLLFLRSRKTEATPEQIQPASVNRRSLIASTARGLLGGFRALGSNRELEEYLATLEYSLISGDVGVKTTEALLSGLKGRFSGQRPELEELESALRAEMRGIFQDGKDGAALLEFSPLTVVCLVGVNGVGKTTTAGKLAFKLSQSGKRVVLGACDTFRAAAPEQLRIWSERASAEVVAGSEGMKPQTVAFQALERAKALKADYLILDTAGRLHTKGNLMQELSGVLRLVGRECPGAPHEVLLVVDATSGQNALEQARAFNEVSPLTGVIITKLDGTPKGGMLFAIRRELGIPVRYIGVGEKAEELLLFSAEDFLDELFLRDAGQGDEALQPIRRRVRGERVS
jgi:fused signal recognition particle receptor